MEDQQLVLETPMNSKYNLNIHRLLFHSQFIDKCERFSIQGGSNHGPLTEVCPPVKIMQSDLQYCRQLLLSSSAINIDLDVKDLTDYIFSTTNLKAYERRCCRFQVD
uniref:Uncharacterized protein n=1 Tax=Ditylenchus dipsaci TaxID=166011 RepID=A0A915D8S1_9BILA